MYDTCECGRTLVRMEKVTGRTDDMLIDLTIDIVRADYRVARDGLVVLAASGLGQEALLQVDIPGVGTKPMIWNESRQLWKGVVRDASVNGYIPDTPGMEVVVNGHEGAQSATINTR